MKYNNQKIILATLILLLSSGARAESLPQAVADRNIETVKSLIRDGADVNQLGHFSVEGSALHVAVRTNQPEIARLLLNSGAMVDIRDQHDYTPLHNAAWNGDLEMVKILLSSGANITARHYSGDTPLSCAYDNNKVEVIEFIKTQLQSAAN